MSELNRQDQKEQTRKLLIEAALSLFAKTGLTVTRTADIANAAGVSHGTVFAHFPTRDDLLVTVIEEFGSRINKRLHELASGESSIKEVLEAHLKGLTEYEAFYTRLVTEGPLLPPAAQNTLVGIRSVVSFHLGQAAERAISAGGIRKIPLHLLFNTWIGLIHYYLANGNLFAPGESVLKRYGPELLEHYLSLLTF